MAWYDIPLVGAAASIFNRPEGADPNKVNLPNYDQNSARISGQLDQPGRGPYQQQSSYTPDWRNLVQQLQSGPSIAQAQYAANIAAARQQMANMARGSTRPGQWRAALDKSAELEQGAAGGAATAMAQEHYARQSALAQALGGASEVEGRVNQANQQAWMNLLGQRLGLDQQQLQALLAREQLKQQNAMMPTTGDRLLKLGGDAAAMYMTGGASAAAGGMPSGRMA